MRQQEPTPLEIRQNRLRWLVRVRQAHTFQHSRRLPTERLAAGIQKLRVLRGSEGAQQECSNVYGAIPRGPFQSLQPSGNMLGRSWLSAAIAWHGVRGRHRRTKIVAGSCAQRKSRTQGG